GRFAFKLQTATKLLGPSLEDPRPMMVTQPVTHPGPVAPPSQEREVAPVRAAWQQWLPAIVVVGLLVAIYWGVIGKLVYDWYTQPDFSHGFLVPPFSAYLVWTKRETLRKTPVRQSWAGVPLIVAGIITLLLGVYGAELFLARISLLMLLGGLI